jgi:hypothetical protein
MCGGASGAAKLNALPHALHSTYKVVKIDQNCRVIFNKPSDIFSWNRYLQLQLYSIKLQQNCNSRAGIPDLTVHVSPNRAGQAAKRCSAEY